MSDLLSAASLFLAVLGLLYSAWYSEIREALNANAPTHKEDRGPVMKTVETTYHTRAWPLTMGAVSLALILLPDLIKTAWSVVVAWQTAGFRMLASYDAVRTLFCAIGAMTILFAGHACSLTLRLRRRIRALRA